MENIQDLIQFGQAFSDPSRIRILNLLIRKNQVCMSDLQSTIGITQTATSRHLKYLRDCDLVTDHVMGKYRFYTIQKDKHALVLTLLGVCKDPLLSSDSGLFNKLREANVLMGAAPIVAVYS